MPRKKKSDVPLTQTAAVPKIPEEPLDQLITGPITMYRDLTGTVEIARPRNRPHR